MRRRPAADVATADPSTSGDRDPATLRDLAPRWELVLANPCDGVVAVEPGRDLHLGRGADALADFGDLAEDSRLSREHASLCVDGPHLPLLDAVRTWCASPSLAVRQQFATMDAMKRLVPDLGMSLAHGDGWREG